MAQWHPVDTLRPTEMIFPRPGSKEPFAIIRWVDVMLEGEPVSRWRVVTWHAEPKKRFLIGDGYYRELEDAAMAALKHAQSQAVPNVLHSHTGPSTRSHQDERAIYR